jgi:hypothetical protein
MSRHERRRAVKLSSSIPGVSIQQERVLLWNAIKGSDDSDVLLEPTNVGQQHKMVLLIKYRAKTFGTTLDIYPEEEPPPEFAALASVHADRLRALLDRPVVLAVHWVEGFPEAFVQVMSAGKPGTYDPNKPFETFTLAFPSEGGAA